MVLQLAGFLVSDPGEAGELVECFGCLLVLVSLPVLIWGCMHYAEGKGHSKWVGLVGLAGCIGLIVLVVLPDQHKEVDDPRDALTAATRLEASGQAAAALRAYQEVIRRFPGTASASDAAASIRSLESKSRNA
jgi:TRAP-type C4-dicarboxylate transport system permease small subunit